ncbi:MAG: hypothetical protein ACI4IK_02765 [Eubacterium sp.]
MEAIAQKFHEICVNIANNSTGVTLGILIVVVLIIGLCLIISKKSRQNALEWVPWVLVGTAVALSAVAIADAIGSTAQF